MIPILCQSSGYSVFRAASLSLLMAGLALAGLQGRAAPRGALLELGDVETTAMPALQAEYQARVAGDLGPRAARFNALGPMTLFRNLIQEHIASQVPSRRVKYASQDSAGQERTYSGRVFLPGRKPGAPPLEAPLVIYQHGTETRRRFVPYYNKGEETMFGALAADLCGFVVAMPDGDGMGADPSPRMHAYCQAGTTTACVIDLIRAALGRTGDGRRIFDDVNLIWDGEIYLVGYSEGGYITMATVKELSTNPACRDLKLTGAACMGGPFDFADAIRSLLADAQSPYERPYIPAYFLSAWQELHPQVLKVAEAFNPLLLKQDAKGNVLEWLRGGLGGDQITPMMQARLTGSETRPVSARAVLNEAWWRQNLADRRSRLNQLLDANSLVGEWKPCAPVFLAHDPYDKTVLFSGTRAMYDTWSRRGYNPMRIVKLALGGTGTGHVGGALVAVPMAFLWIDAGMPRTIKKMAQDKLRARIREAAPPELETNAEALSTSLGLQEANENRALLPLSRIDVPAGASPYTLAYADKVFKIGKVKLYTMEEAPVFPGQNRTRGMNQYTRLVKEMKSIGDSLQLQPGKSYYMAVYPEKGGVALTLGFQNGTALRLVNIKQVKNKIIGSNNASLTVSPNFKAAVNPAGFDHASDGRGFIALPRGPAASPGPPARRLQTEIPGPAR